MDVVVLVGVVTMGVVVVPGVVGVVVAGVVVAGVVVAGVVVAGVVVAGVVVVGVVVAGVVVSVEVGVSVTMLCEFVAVSVPKTVITVFAGSAAICAWPAAPVNTKPLIS